MAFELTHPTNVVITNANPRRELHGEEKVRAIDLACSLTGENTLLDLIEPGLRAHHYCNKAAKDGQDEIPGLDIPLPNLRHPQLPLLYHYGKGLKFRGYRLTQDWGLDDYHVDFTDVVVSSQDKADKLEVRTMSRFPGDSRGRVWLIAKEAKLRKVA